MPTDANLSFLQKVLSSTRDQSAVFERLLQEYKWGGPDQRLDLFVDVVRELALLHALYPQIEQRMNALEGGVK